VCKHEFHKHQQAAQLANEAEDVATPTPKKRPLGLGQYFIKVKKQKSEEDLVKDEESQPLGGLVDVKDEEVKQEKHDLQDGGKHDPHTPKEKCTRDDFVRWGKKGGRPSSSTKKTPVSIQKLIIQKASKEDLEEQAAMNKERYKNAKDKAMEKMRK